MSCSRRTVSRKSRIRDRCVDVWIGGWVTDGTTMRWAEGRGGRGGRACDVRVYRRSPPWSRVGVPTGSCGTRSGCVITGTDTGTRRVPPKALESAPTAALGPGGCCKFPPTTSKSCLWPTRLTFVVGASMATLSSHFAGDASRDDWTSWGLHACRQRSCCTRGWEARASSAHMLDSAAAWQTGWCESPHWRGPCATELNWGWDTNAISGHVDPHWGKVNVCNFSSFSIRSQPGESWETVRNGGSACVSDILAGACEMCASCRASATWVRCERWLQASSSAAGCSDWY